MRIPLACCLLSCVVDVDLFFISSLPSLFRFRSGHRLFHPVFFLRVLCCLLGFGFCCDSFNIWYICTLIYTYVRALISPFCFSSEVYDLLQLLGLLSTVLFVFLPWGNLPLQSYWSTSCDHGLHCSDELIWEQQQQQQYVDHRGDRLALWGHTSYYVK